ncbi:hypothetical protein [Nocardioides sp. MH1]|uniref:hypothetical protein n=1 Tax=Nocardioides sp. MH1 TaxID=3242490 RepID=UPI003520CE37
MPDIAEQLDAAIGSPPDPAPALDRTLVAGRRALRRRRLAYVAGAAATVVVVGGTAWAAAPGDGPHRSDGPGFSAPATATPTAAGTPEQAPDDGLPVQPDWMGQDAVMLGRGGEVLVRPGWTLTDRVDEVNGPGTIGLEVVKGDRRQWFLFGSAMTISSLHAPSEGYATFQEWIDVNGPLIEAHPPKHHRHRGPDGTEDGWPGVQRDDLVAFGSGETLVALDGATILEQRPSPDVGDAFATAADTSAVALVRADGKEWYVLARRTDGPAQYIAVPRAESGADLDAFLAFARDRYAEGGGGLL